MSAPDRPRAPREAPSPSGDPRRPFMIPKGFDSRHFVMIAEASISDVS